MIIDYNNLLTVNNFAHIKAVSDEAIYKGIKKKYINAIKIDGDSFVIIDKNALMYTPQHVNPTKKPLPLELKPSLYIDTDIIMSIGAFAKVKKVRPYSVSNWIKTHQINAIYIDSTPFVILDEKARIIRKDISQVRRFKITL